MDLRFYRNLVILNGGIPLLVLAWDAWRGQLGANSVNNALHITGILSLVFLLLSLLVTPLRTITGWNSLVAYRRALGLYAFFYASLHFGIYVVFDRMGSISSTFDEIASRRFLLVGFIAVMLMLPLAITSTNGMIRRLGSARWKRLHRFAYLAAILGVVHYYLLVKSDVRQPLAFAAVLTPILGFRGIKHYLDLRRSAHRSTQTAPRQEIAHKYFQGALVVANIRSETHDVKTFRLVAPSGGDIPFTHQPGQYMNLSLTVRGQNVRRSYTIASAPSQRGYVELTIKRDPQGTASCHLHDTVCVGDTIRIGAPAGKFSFDGKNGGAVLLIAGGVGITPLMAILRYLTDHAWTGEIFFVNAIRTRADWIFQQELRDLAIRFSNVHIKTYFSQEVPHGTNGMPADRWEEKAGYIDAVGLKEFVPNITAIPIYLCGPDSMMKAVRQLLTSSLGIRQERILTEEFISPQGVRGGTTEGTIDRAIPLAPVPAYDAPAEVRFSKSGKISEIAAEQTVLDAAEEARVPLNWECRSGICGQCKVRCISGKVRMDSRDALSDHEAAMGYILACQSHPLEATLCVDA
jgi:glycine betaine catabolism B